VLIYVQGDTLNKWLVKQQHIPLISITEKVVLTLITVFIMGVVWVGVSRYETYIQASIKTQLKSL
jgi:hypothetical protein